MQMLLAHPAAQDIKCTVSDSDLSTGLLRTQSRAQHMIKHIQSNVDSELERWVVRHSAGALQSAYAEVSTNSHHSVAMALHCMSLALLIDVPLQCNGDAKCRAISATMYQDGWSGQF